MKNLLITSALTAALAVPAFANDSIIDQIGASNTADVTQTGGTGGESSILQTGDGDSATVTQSDGTGVGLGTNLADIDQLGGSGSQAATITQTNASNGAQNSATILQDSTQGGNTALIDQDGDGNIASAQQGPADAINCTVFGCGGTTPADITNSFASIDQTGSTNTATTTQIVGSNGGDGNGALITQDGTSNTADIAQGTGAVAASGLFFPSFPNPASTDNANFADIVQTGDNNTSAIFHGGEAGFATNSQDGGGNDSMVVQSGLGNSATVGQIGDDNISDVSQTSANGDLPVFPTGVTADVNQIGNRNESLITQAPLGGHTASVMQMSDDSFSLIEQDGLLNTADVLQEMTDQNSEIFQTGPSVVGPLGNTALVSQVASAGNNSLVTQGGVGNFSDVMQ